MRHRIGRRLRMRQQPRGRHRLQQVAAAAREHRRQHGARGEDVRHHVHVPAALPLGVGVSLVAVDRDAGVRAEQIDRAVPLDGLSPPAAAHRPRATRRPRARCRRSPRRLAPPRRRRCRRRRSPSAPRRRSAGKRTADAVAAAGDDDDRVGEAHSKMKSSRVSASRRQLSAQPNRRARRDRKISYDSLRSLRFRSAAHELRSTASGRCLSHASTPAASPTSFFTVRDAANSTTARIAASTGTMYIAVCSPSARNGSSARRSNPFDSPDQAAQFRGHQRAERRAAATAPAALAVWNVK